MSIKFENIPVRTQTLKSRKSSITINLPPSDQLKQLSPIDLSNNVREIQEQLNQFQDELASYWLDTKS